MSRDWSPMELDMVQKRFNMPNMVDMGWVMHIDGQEDKPMFSQDDMDMAHAYPRLGKFGFDFLSICRYYGILSSEKGNAIIQSIEDYFNGVELTDKELKEKVDLWYDGQLEPGYDLHYNNEALADYVKNRIKEE